MRTTHELKIWPEYFEQVRNGRMRFQLRRSDRDYKVGDQLLLKEWNPQKARYETQYLSGPPNTGAWVEGTGYTGRELLVRLDYIMDNQTVDRLMNRFQEGAQMSGYIIMSISLLP